MIPVYFFVLCLNCQGLVLLSLVPIVASVAETKYSASVAMDVNVEVFAMPSSSDQRMNRILWPVFY